MRHRHGWLLSAVLLLTAGCAGEATTQTSMMRGPTPSSGMTIPRLLTASAPPKSTVGSGELDSELSIPADSSGADAPSEETPPPDSGLETLPPETEIVPTDPDQIEPLPTDATVPDPGVPTVDPGTGVDLGAIAATFGCTDYADQPAMPLTSGYAECLLGEDPVQLYAFATDEDQGAFIEQLAGLGMSVDQFVQGQRYLVIPAPTQLETVRAALSAG